MTKWISYPVRMCPSLLERFETQAVSHLVVIISSLCIIRTRSSWKHCLTCWLIRRTISTTRLKNQKKCFPNPSSALWGPRSWDFFAHKGCLKRGSGFFTTNSSQTLIRVSVTCLWRLCRLFYPLWAKVQQLLDWGDLIQSTRL